MFNIGYLYLISFSFSAQLFCCCWAFLHISCCSIQRILRQIFSPTAYRCLQIENI